MFFTNSCMQVRISLPSWHTCQARHLGSFYLGKFEAEYSYVIGVSDLLKFSAGTEHLLIYRCRFVNLIRISHPCIIRQKIIESKRTP